MSRDNAQLLSVVMVVAILLSGFVCFVDCDADDCCPSDPSKQQCALDCACHTVGLLAPGSFGALPRLDAREVVLQSGTINDRLVCADIFNPPRV